MTTDHLFEGSLGNHILSLIAFNQVLEALSHNHLNFGDLEQIGRLSAVKEFKHLFLKQIHWDAFGLISVSPHVVTLLTNWTPTSNRVSTLFVLILWLELLCLANELPKVIH